MNESQLAMASGLTIYLNARNWSFEKLRSIPHGSTVDDINLYHSIYISNAFSAIDHVADLLSAADKALFKSDLASAFKSPDVEGYTRELRNSIIHRGLDPAPEGHSDGTILSCICPPAVKNFKGDKVFNAPCVYWKDLAHLINQATNVSIASAAAKFGALPDHATKEDVDMITASLAAVGFAAQLEPNKIAEEIVSTRTKKLRAALCVS